MLTALNVLEQRIGEGSLGTFLQQIGDRHAAKPEEPVTSFIFRAAESDDDAKVVIESGVLALGTDP
jgi:hypothetical protein